MIIRIFDTAMDPGDIEKGKQIFLDTVRPAFEKFPGCDSIDMYIGIEEHSGDLVDVAAISRWDSLESLEKAIDSAEYEEALEDFRQLFRQTPIVRHFEKLG
jgi:antibiotic biosynthesis monooxygenase (ABM) superfamily enzyme